MEVTLEMILEEMEAQGYEFTTFSGLKVMYKETSIGQIKEAFSEGETFDHMNNNEYGGFYRGYLFWFDDQGFMLEHDQGTYLTHGVGLTEKAIRKYWEGLDY